MCAQSNKSPGPDGIAAELLVRAAWLPADGNGKRPEENALWTALLALYNRVLRTHEIPSSWREAHVTPVYKKGGDPRDANNCRPIPVMDAMAKVFQLIIQGRLSTYVESSGVLPDAQCGFRPGRRVEDAVYMLTELVQARFAHPHRQRRQQHARYTYCAFVDVKKAYDSVYHSAMFVELWRQGVRGPVWRLLRAWYSGSQRRVKLGGGLSSTYSPDAGVAQGEIPSPLIYAVFVNLVFQALERSALASQH